MTDCQSEGNLRAFLDGELEPAEMAVVTAHLRECAVCDALRRELAGRAAFVSVLMGDLKAEAPRIVSMPAPRPDLHWQRWAGVAAVIAAGFVIGILTLPKPAGPEQPPVKIATAHVGASVPAPQVVLPRDSGQIHVASAPTAVRVTRTPGKRNRPSQPLPQVNLDGFITLDDEPFEAGMLVRVTLGTEQIPADVVFSADGRARAYRLVGEGSNQ